MIAQRIRVGLRGAALVVHALVGMFFAAVVFRFVGAAARSAITRRWSRGVLHISGMRLDLVGAPRASLGGCLMICNHVSWLDIYVLNALQPAHFIAKAEIGSWPIIGLLAKASGTIFIERGRRHAVHDVIEVMVGKLQAGEPCIIFPEGTTSDGSGLLPFHANLLQAAIKAGAPMQPLTLRYLQDGRPTTVPAYIGDDVLAHSVVKVFGSTRLSVRLQVLDPITPQPGETRHHVAHNAREAMAAALGVATGASDGAVVAPAAPVAVND